MNYTARTQVHLELREHGTLTNMIEPVVNSDVGG
jgi:hypothetical protein